MSSFVFLQIQFTSAGPIQIGKKRTQFLIFGGSNSESSGILFSFTDIRADSGRGENRVKV